MRFIGGPPVLVKSDLGEHERRSSTRQWPRLQRWPQTCQPDATGEGAGPGEPHLAGAVGRGSSTFRQDSRLDQRRRRAIGRAGGARAALPSGVAPEFQAAIDGLEQPAPDPLERLVERRRIATGDPGDLRHGHLPLNTGARPRGDRPRTIAASRPPGRVGVPPGFHPPPPARRRSG